MKIDIGSSLPPASLDGAEKQSDITHTFLPLALLDQSEQQPDKTQSIHPTALLQQASQHSEEIQCETTVQQNAAEESITVSHPNNGNAARQSAMSLSEQQLLGTYPAGHELDDYELRERPMGVGG